MKKYIFIYKTTNIINNKIYIGIHSTNNIEDNYLGSGVNLLKDVKLFKRKNFIKNIICFCDSFEEALLIERQIVDEEFLLRDDVYNISIGGNGGVSFLTEETKKKISESVKKTFENGRLNWNQGKKYKKPYSEDEKKRRSELMKGENNPMFGKNVKDIIGEERDLERRKKLSQSLRKPKYSNEKYKEYSGKRFFIVNEEGVVKHCLDLNDERLLSGKFQRGRKWKETLMKVDSNIPELMINLI